MELINQETKQYITKVLQLDSIEEVIDKDYSDINEVHDVDRQEFFSNYAERNRGSVRLNSGLFYTAREYSSWATKVLSTKLP